MMNLAGNKLEKFEDLVGQVLTKIDVIKSYGDDEHGDEIIFTLRNGESYRLFHEQECCEDVYIEDICGYLVGLVWTPILLAEEVSYKNENPDGINVLGQDLDIEERGSFTWTFYKLSSFSDHVTIRWYGAANAGYYSEKVSFEKVGPEDG